MIIAIHLLFGVLLAVLVIAFARWRRAEDLVFGAGLAIAAAVYVVGAIRASGHHDVLVELAGFAIFGGVAFLGTRGWRRLLAAGWATHVLWDVLLHFDRHGDYMPWWYPILCLGFDLFLAGYIAGTAVQRKEKTT